MYPPTAEDSPGRYPAALLHDPETAEEVREALAIARAEARAAHDQIGRLTSAGAALAAALDDLKRWHLYGPRRLDRMQIATRELDSLLADSADLPGALVSSLTAALTDLRALRDALQPSRGDSGDPS